MKKNRIVLEMCGITKTFPGVLALDRVDFDLHAGEVHVLLGENGAGKSTLIKILSGVHPKTSGRVLLNGTEVEIRNPKEAHDLGIATIYQELNLVPQLTAAENVFLGREPLLFNGIIDRKSMVEKTLSIFEDLHISIPVSQPVRTLGIAQQQMVEIAKSLSVDARIFIMDEPTSALSEKEIQALFELIHRLKQRNLSIIYISHRLEELFKIGDRVTVLRDGKKVGRYPIQDMTIPELITLMVNREMTRQFPVREASTGEEILRVEGLTRTGSLDHIDFSLHRGEILGVVGLLGSGRTELARALFGIDPIDSGRILINGKDVTGHSPRKSIRMGMGFLTEDRKSEGLVLKLSIRDNICLASMDNLSTLGIVRREKENTAAENQVRNLRIRSTGLKQKALFLSGGNQQKVVLAKWLCTNASILIFDEPTRGIDVGAKYEIYEWMNKLSRQGVAILMISSELPEILGMSDRILVMHQGRIRGRFAIEEATQESLLECALGA